MEPSIKSENWLDGVFENEAIGESLSKLTEEYDGLIESDKSDKSEDAPTSSSESQNIEVEKLNQSTENLLAESKKQAPKKTDSLKSTKSLTKSIITAVTPKNRRESKQSVTSQSIASQLPKPVECIEVETDDHYCVPPIVIDGKTVTNFQYLTLHEPKKLFCDETVEKPTKKLKFLKQTTQKLSHAISNVLRTNQNAGNKKVVEKSPLKELYNETFKIEEVGDLNKNKND